MQNVQRRNEMVQNHGRHEQTIRLKSENEKMLVRAKEKFNEMKRAYDMQMKKKRVCSPSNWLISAGLIAFLYRNALQMTFSRAENDSLIYLRPRSETLRRCTSGIVLVEEANDRWPDLCKKTGARSEKVGDDDGWGCVWKYKHVGTDARARGDPDPIEMKEMTATTQVFMLEKEANDAVLVNHCI